MALENKIKEKYQKIIDVIKTYYKQDNPTFYSVAKATGVDTSSVIRYLNDWESYQVIYGIKAKPIYDTIQAKIKMMEEKNNSTNIIINEANEYLENDYTLDEFTKVKGLDKRTIKSHFKKLAEINPELFNLVNNKIIKMAPKDELNKQIIKEAKYYLKHNYTVIETATKLEISKRTLQNHFQKLAEIDPELFDLIRQKQEVNQIEGRKLGGENGKRTRTYSKEEANRIADVLINAECTLDELSELTGIPHTTLYDMLVSDYIDDDKKTKIEAVFQANHRHMTVDTLMAEKDRKVI